MKIELTTENGKFIGENDKREDVFADVDFQGHFMVQVDLRDMTFTGMGMDGGGYPLPDSFYKNSTVKEIK